jgi:hypothetical protein
MHQARCSACLRKCLRCLVCVAACSLTNPTSYVGCIRNCDHSWLLDGQQIQVKDASRGFEWSEIWSSNNFLCIVLLASLDQSVKGHLKHDMLPLFQWGCAIAQAVSRWLPTVAARVRSRGLVMWDLWWTNWRWGRFSPRASASPVNLHSTNSFTIIIIYHLGLLQ